MKVRAGSRPPTSSMTMSTSGLVSTRAASLVMGSVRMSRPSRGRVRSVSPTATRARWQPARSSSIARCEPRIFTTPAPTVPRPSRPRRTVFTSAVQLLEAAQRLLDALLVLHEGEAHVALAVLAEADPGGHGDVRLLNQHLGELERADAAVLLRNGDRKSV